MSFIVFGDVHGRADLLSNLLTALKDRFGKDLPQIYSTGDLIDRGFGSKTVIELCVQHGVKAVLGNHETWLHRYLATDEFDNFALHPMMGGIATLTGYGVPALDVGTIEQKLKFLVPQSHKDFILSTPVYREIVDGDRKYRLTHAGLKKMDAAVMFGLYPQHIHNEHDLFNLVAQNNPACVLWVGTDMKDPQVYAPCWDKSIQIFGHTPVRVPVFAKHFVALDTGCGTCPPNNLTAVLFPQKEVLTVNSLTGKIHTGMFETFDLV